MIIKILLLIVFFAVMLYIGYYSRHQAKTVEGYVLGGRNVGPWISAFAYGTSYFSAVVFVGYAGQFGWRYGLASTWIGIGNAVIGSLLAWIILGRRTRVMTKHMNSATMPAYFESRYDSKTLKIVASAIIFIFLIPYTASVYNGLSNLFEMAFGIPYIYCVCMMAVLTCVYVLMGGYTATVYNDFVQGIIMLLGIVIVILSVLNGHGGFMNAVRQLSEIPSDNPITMGQPSVCHHSDISRHMGPSADGPEVLRNQVREGCRDRNDRIDILRGRHRRRLLFPRRFRETDRCLTGI